MIFESTCSVVDLSILRTVYHPTLLMHQLYLLWTYSKTD